MRKLLTAAALSLGLFACGQSETGASQPAATPERAEIEGIVRDYILENPEIIEEALIELQRRARDRERMTQAQAVEAHAQRLFADARDPVAGADDPVVTIVEFFDYRCPYCALSNDWVQSAMERHGDRVRLIYKEFPVLGEDSVRAARAALAVWRTAPEKYEAFHNAMVTVSGPLPDARIDEIAAELGIDVGLMREEMRSEAITRHIEDVRSLARAIGATGTPFFIVGDSVFPGADMAGLERALNRALENAG